MATIEQLQEKMYDLVQQAYQLGYKEGFKDGNEGREAQSPTKINKAKPKSVEEVYAFMLEEYPQLEKIVSWRIANKWWNHFSANGFKVGGKTAMKDWRASVRNWDKEKELAEANNKPQQVFQRKFNI